MKKKENETKIYINKSAELLIWLVIILTITAVLSLKNIHRELNDTNDYHVFLPDVDGLIIGSPVRMMGIEVGHVVKIKPVKDEVYIKFILKDPDIVIPRGTKITVEFTGMAGSKSLELYPPDKTTYIDSDTPIFDVNSPKRLRDALALLDDMYKKLTSIIWNVSSFGEKLDKAKLDLLNVGSGNVQFGEFLEYSNEFLDESTHKADELRKSMEEFKSNGK